ncbi:MAG: DUF6350 family protein [Pseudolysinimonas sp.]|uniref:cell division protein PerM n=1 Tax=Pseudolysinimonas sp. TaxID=2680009 RepID=UPI003C76D288
MTRRLTMLFAGLESLLVLAIGVAIPLAPLTIVWGVHFGFAPEWTVFWRAAVDVWLLGHGVDVTFTLDPLLAEALGMPAAADPVKVTIALLGFALLTLLLGARAGGRIAEAGHRVLGGVTAIVVFGAASLGVTATVLHAAARPSLWQGLILPATVFGAGVVIGVLRSRRAGDRDALGRWLDDRSPELRAAAGAALRAGIGAVAITAAVAALLVALLFVLRFPDMIGLYEALHTEVVGGIALTAGQLAILPNLVLWAVAWLVGPGFAIGVGSHVSPVGTALGPIPALPVFGALPTGDSAFGFAGILVPVVAGFLAGVAVRPGLARALGYLAPLTVLGAAVGGGIVGGALIGFLAAASGGAAGPGRLVEVGPDPVAVGLVAALEFAVAIGIGLAAASRLPAPQRVPR